jgi:hypothetical protein
LQQREFDLAERVGYAAVKHQRFVGTGYFDAVATVVSSGQSSTCALAGSTEAAQFEKRPVNIHAINRHQNGNGHYKSNGHGAANGHIRQVPVVGTSALSHFAEDEVGLIPSGD